FDGVSESDVEYSIARGDLALARAVGAGDAHGQFTTMGHVTGTGDTLKWAGDANVTEVAIGGVSALTAQGRYVATMPRSNPSMTAGQVTGQASFITVAGTSIEQATGTVQYDRGLVDADLQLAGATGLAGASALSGTIKTAFQLASDRRSLQLRTL